MRFIVRAVIPQLCPDMHGYTPPGSSGRYAKTRSARVLLPGRSDPDNRWTNTLLATEDRLDGGCMPARTALSDMDCNSLFDFGT